jgi:hypothetical protein
MWGGGGALIVVVVVVESGWGRIAVVTGGRLGCRDMETSFEIEDLPRRRHHAYTQVKVCI